MRTIILTLLVAIMVVQLQTETASAYCRKRGPFIVGSSTEIAQATGGVMRHAKPALRIGQIAELPQKTRTIAMGITKIPEFAHFSTLPEDFSLPAIPVSGKIRHGDMFYIPGKDGFLH